MTISSDEIAVKAFLYDQPEHIQLFYKQQKEAIIRDLNEKFLIVPDEYKDVYLVAFGMAIQSWVEENK